MIQLSKENTDKIVKDIQSYFADNLGQEIGNFDAMFLLEFFTEKVGPHFYNQALSDVHSLISKRTEETLDSLSDLIQTEEK